ncbi:RNA polymerase sigma factor [Cochleicola gelatinilyticus]|uniref:RNA polymerase subunit sigma-24 n=1 Tax=Cochleicola gelatinilyticus TaxID=1763537 RepID=A0A167GWZ3_9FLAO|nr:sigma-70 family RNA polymerase sigma factor [Cochleicola gelatinilyticus]OAB77990.1 RNA polymerase subunit sigma-24 [Cochleicola gelatinilyticus]
MTNQDDSFYINKVKQGDLQAYTYLVDKYKNMAFSIALKLSRNTEDAEDAVQESFIKAYHKIDTFAYNSKFSTWLYSIVYRTTAYNLRKNTISTQEITDTTFHNLEDDENTDLSDAEQKRFITEAIDKLPEIESIIITLFYLNDNTIAEIESITGLSKSNIKVKLFRARKALKIELKHILKDEIKSIL